MSYLRALLLTDVVDSTRHSETLGSNLSIRSLDCYGGGPTSWLH